MRADTAVDNIKNGELFSFGGDPEAILACAVGEEYKIVFLQLPCRDLGLGVGFRGSPFNPDRRDFLFRIKGGDPFLQLFRGCQIRKLLCKGKRDGVSFAEIKAFGNNGMLNKLFLPVFGVKNTDRLQKTVDDFYRFVGCFNAVFKTCFV